MGLSQNFGDDYEMLRHAMVMYDALYTWCARRSAAPHSANGCMSRVHETSCHGRSALPIRGRWLALLVLCLNPVPCSFAQGGPPMLTDDPGTPGSGVWEINAAYLEQRTRQERLRSFPHVDFNYGLGEHIQLKYETGWLIADAPEGGGVKSGLDDSLLGLKWRILDQERSGLDMSVYPQLQVENSTGSVARGIAEPGPNLFLQLEIAHDFGTARLVGEVGYQYFRAQENEWVVGVLGALEVSDTLELLAEVRSFSERFLDRGDVVVNLGVRQALSSGVKLLASVGTGLTNGPGATTFIAYLGVQLVLGENKKQ